MTLSIPIWVALLWVLNFGISWWNARVTGIMWVESKQAGGFIRVLTWCGAIMSACGFIWCYMILEAFVLHWMMPEKVTSEVM